MRSANRPMLSLFDFTMIVIGLVIGMGIFRTASDSARAAITPTVFFAAWLFGGVIALCGALTYAEIGSRYPVTGGYYRIFAKAYHPSVAFAINCIILISNAASLAAVALIGSEYLSETLFAKPPSDLMKSLIAMGSILLFYFVNLMGLRMSSKTQNILMSVKIGMILLLITALFFPEHHHTPSVVTEVLPVAYTLTDYITSFGGALVAVCFTYGGYQQTINFGDEIKCQQTSCIWFRSLECVASSLNHSVLRPQSELRATNLTLTSPSYLLKLLSPKQSPYLKFQ